MSNPGPIPKRSEARTRRNKENRQGLTVKRGVAIPVKQWPNPSPDWEEAVHNIYAAFKNTGMREYYQQTDVSGIWFACEAAHRWLEQGKPSAQMFDSLMKAFGTLGAFEGERRRMQIELEEPGAEEAEAERELALVYDIANDPEALGDTA